MSGYLKRANTCSSECAEKNHPGREHVEWAAERIAEAREISSQVDAYAALARELATVVDPLAFEDSTDAGEDDAHYWAARRAVAIEHADRVLRSGWLAARDANYVRAIVEAERRGASRALREAASEWERGPDYKDRRSYVAKWLRKRAAQMESKP